MLKFFDILNDNIMKKQIAIV